MPTTPVGTSSPKRSDGARRAEILDAAAQLFASSGYVGTSLKDIADACGILAGSLYHHFESKESIAVELLERYQTQLDEVGNKSLARGRTTDPANVFDRVATFGGEIAACALNNKAALQLTQYEPRAAAGEQLIAVAQRRSATVNSAMRTLLDDARAAGYLKQTIDLWTLSEQICESMLHVGSSILHRNADAQTIAEELCRILLEGLVLRVPRDAQLNRSSAMVAARSAMARWTDAAVDHEDTRLAELRDVARIEFARRGYEATTIRHIAAAASMGTGTVYRTIGSKSDLLDSIMARFHTLLSDGYGSVSQSQSSAVEKLDALMWINLNALEHFEEEFRIQRAWFRLTPPETSAVSGAIAERGRLVEDVLASGRADGEFRLHTVTIRQLTDSVRDLTWIPPHVFQTVGKAAALAHLRSSLLRGAALRRHVRG